MCVYIYIYIFMERERERDADDHHEQAHQDPGHLLDEDVDVRLSCVRSCCYIVVAYVSLVCVLCVQT